MRDAKTLVFVEVRFRRSADYGGPAETVDRGKQGKLRASAEHYLQRHRGAAKQPCRFDVVALSGAPGQEATGMAAERLRWVKHLLLGMILRRQERQGETIENRLSWRQWRLNSFCKLL